LLHERVALLLTSLGEEKQNEAQQTIENLVTSGLQKIFDESLSFHIVQSVRGKASSLEFQVRTATTTGRDLDTSVMDARGGGIAAVIGFLLRLVVFLLRPDSPEKFMVLDESFAHVSDEYLPSLGAFLRELVDRTSVQIVMVTHQPQFADYADKVYRFSSENDLTRVEVG